MSRVLNPDSAGSERTRLTKTIVVAIRELMKQTEPTDTSRDLIAYLLISMERIYETVDISVAAWEKRGYWVKAERFRMDWDWTRVLSERLRPAVEAENYGEVIPVAVKIAEALGQIKVSERHRYGTPWTGFWAILQSRNQTH